MFICRVRCSSMLVLINFVFIKTIKIEILKTGYKIDKFSPILWLN